MRAIALPLRGLVLSLVLSSFAHAATIEKPLADATQEATARAIFTELKCVVCEGQALADSDAALARDMRQQVRKLVHAGKSREEVLHYFSERYGEHILMTPPLSPATVLLWMAPLVLLLGGALLIRRATRAPS